MEIVLLGVVGCFILITGRGIIGFVGVGEGLGFRGLTSVDATGCVSDFSLLSDICLSKFDLSHTTSKAIVQVSYNQVTLNHQSVMIELKY